MAPRSSDEASSLARFRLAEGETRGPVFEDVFRAHRRRVLDLCSRLCGDRALAEDAFQETFIDVFRALPSFRGESLIGTWVYRLALRTALRVRARHRKRATLGDDVSATVPVADAADANAVLAAREQTRLIRRAFSELPAEQRTVLALFCDEGLSHAEIATILGVPEGTVWSRLHKARRALAAALG